MNPMHALRSTLCAAGLVALTLPVVAQSVSATLEVVFSTPEGASLRDKATELRTAAPIYEYLRNTLEYTPYWGSASGSVNTFMGQTGNDVDQASALIAMLRSQGIPARYVVGTVRMTEAQLMNWLGVRTPGAAGKVLDWTNTQKLVRNTTGPYAGTFEFEHVWVEAMVSFSQTGQYRGVPINAGNECVQKPTECSWVPLDASYKQKSYIGLNVDLYPTVMWDDTDYTNYYDAIANSDKYRKNKNPVAILEQDALAAANLYPGHSLEDVVDKGQIIPVREGVLPASLPYQVVGNVRRYDSVALHDQAEANTPWGKRLYVAVLPCNPANAANADGANKQSLNSPQTFLLSELVTDRLMLTHSVAANGSINIELRQGRTPGSTPVKTWNFSTVACAEGSKTFDAGSQMYVQLNTNPDPGNNPFPPAQYTEMVAGRYLLATGGETSNWSQVHRAAASMLDAAKNYKIVYNSTRSLNGQTCDVATGSGCIPYIDRGPAGWDAADQLLTDDAAANNALIGGLLEVAGTQYFAKLNEDVRRADGLMSTKTPIARFLGLVESKYTAEYLADGTAFSIQPQGLVINMIGVYFGPCIRVKSEAGEFGSPMFRFLGHVMSSLEHEVWQELTGYDAVSTVRSIQLSRAAGSSVKTYQKNSAANDRDVFLNDMGFVANAPAPFKLERLDMFNTWPVVWSHPSSDGSAAFDFFIRAPWDSASASALPRVYRNDGLANFLLTMDACHDGLLTNPVSGPWSPYVYHHFSLPSDANALAIPALQVVCFVQFLWGDFVGLRYPPGYPTPPAVQSHAIMYAWQVGGQLGAYFNSWREQSSIKYIFDSLNAGQGFNPQDYVFRSATQLSGKYSTSQVFDVSRELHTFNAGTGSLRYTMPLAPAISGGYKVESYIREEFDNNSNATAIFFNINVTQ